MAEAEAAKSDGAEEEMTEEEMASLVEELETAMEALQEKSKEIYEAVTPDAGPTMERDPALRTADRDPTLDFLATKMEMLLSYCINHAFYLLIKVNRGKVAGHPVINELLVMRGVMERMRPIDAQVNGELEKLFKEAAREPAPSSGPGAAGDVLLDDDPEADLRPRLDMMMDAADDRDGLGGSEGGGGGGRNDVYRAPRMSATPFEEDSRSAAKEERRLQRKREKLQRSELLRGIRSDVLGAPEEVAGGIGGTSGLAEDKVKEIQKKNKEVQDWEEEHYIRRQVTKKERRAQKRALAMSSRLESVADVGDIRSIIPQRGDGGDQQDPFSGVGGGGGGKKRKQKRRKF